MDITKITKEDFSVVDTVTTDYKLPEVQKQMAELQAKIDKATLDIADYTDTRNGYIAEWQKQLDSLSALLVEVAKVPDPEVIVEEPPIEEIIP